jgi:hypothetical protein
MNRSRALALLAVPFVIVGCSAAQVDGDGASENVSSTDESLSGCHGHASSSIPADNEYDLTTFGGPGDSQPMSCGESTRNGTWYYMASRQRFGCGAHVRITTATKCVVAEADDYGPDVCVEAGAGRPVIDASPMVSRALFNVSSAGWSEHRLIHAEVVDPSTPLGPCDLSADDAPITPDPTPDSTPAPLEQCFSYTLQQQIPLQECVQSVNDHRWYQCTSMGWVKLYSDGTGPLGACTASFPL